MDDMTKIIVELTEPVTHGGTELTELEFRKIATKDLIAIGNVYNFSGDDDEVAIDVNTKRISKYIVKLASVPPSVVSSLSTEDFVACQDVVLGFFRKLGEKRQQKTSNE